jgi:hypothetical protein
MTNPCQMVNVDRFMLLADLNGSKGGGIISKMKPNLGGYSTRGDIVRAAKG